MKTYPYVHKFVDRSGIPRLYFRRRGRPHIALPGPLGSPEFTLAYTAALNEPAIVASALPGGVIAKRGRNPNTVQPLVGVYLLLLRGKIVYVGSSLNMPTRVADHRTNGRAFDQAFYIATAANQREALERVLIKAIDPSQNRRHRANGSEHGSNDEVANLIASLPIWPKNTDETRAIQ